MLQIYPANDDVLYARSLVAEKLDLLDQMEQDLRDILARDPEDARALNALGYTLADRTDRYQEALGYIEKAAIKAPDDPAVIDSLGWVHYRLGNLELARKHLQRAYDLSGDAEIAAHLGEVLWQLGDRAGAEAVWREARESQPENDVLERTIQRFLP
jgi:tetratricopeptide (TPR) repeat protein